MSGRGNRGGGKVEVVDHIKVAEEKEGIMEEVSWRISRRKRKKQ
jgi:hypothetical protein